MRIVKASKINRELSLEYPKKYMVEVIKGRCYFVVNEVVSAIYEKREFDLFEKLDVAFGYLGNPDEIMSRHCFFIYKNEAIIDPTYPYTEYQNEYHIIKTFNLIDYDNIYREFVNGIPDDYTPSFKGIPEEKEYCDYLINKKIRINVTDFEFVEPFNVDKDNTHCVHTNKNFMISDSVELYHDSAGRPLYFDDINLLENGEMFWAWIIMDDKLCTYLSIKESDNIYFEKIDHHMSLDGFYKVAGKDIYGNNRKIYGQKYLESKMCRYKD